MKICYDDMTRLAEYRERRDQLRHQTLWQEAAMIV